MKAKTTEEAVFRLKELGPTCSPRQLAGILGGQPYYFNQAAKNGVLGYEHTWSGNRLKIYTESVIQKITGGNGNGNQIYR